MAVRMVLIKIIFVMLALVMNGAIGWRKRSLPTKSIGICIRRAYLNDRFEVG